MIVVFIARVDRTGSLVSRGYAALTTGCDMAPLQGAGDDATVWRDKLLRAMLHRIHHSLAVLKCLLKCLDVQAVMAKIGDSIIRSGSYQITDNRIITSYKGTMDEIFAR